MSGIPKSIIYNGKKGELKDSLRPSYSRFSKAMLARNGTPIDDYRLDEVKAIYRFGRPDYFAGAEFVLYNDNTYLFTVLGSGRPVIRIEEGSIC